MGLSEQTLTQEQMKTLRALGVDTTKASVVLIYKDMNDHEIEWDDVLEDEDHEFYCIDEYNDEEITLEQYYLDAETGDYDHSYRESCGVFTFQDMLKMVPDNVVYDERKFKFYMEYTPEEGLEMSYVTEDSTKWLECFKSKDYLQLSYIMLKFLAEHKLI